MKNESFEYLFWKGKALTHFLEYNNYAGSFFKIDKKGVEKKLNKIKKKLYKIARKELKKHT